MRRIGVVAVLLVALLGAGSSMAQIQPGRGGGGGSGLPAQAGHAGEWLTTNGAVASWAALAGGGTVTNTGLLTSGKVVIGNAGTDIKVDTGCSTNGTGTLTCVDFVVSGAGAGYTQWATAAMGVSAAGTVRCGAHTGNLFSCSDNGGTVTPVAFLANHLGGTQASPQVNNFLLTSDATTGSKSITRTLANAGVTGTTVKYLAIATGAPSTAVVAGATTTGLLGIVVNAGGGTSGNAEIAQSGRATCTFVGATTAGHFVQADGVAGKCKDGGATFPTSGGDVVGIVTATIGAAGDADVWLWPPIPNASTGGGTVTFIEPGLRLTLTSGTPVTTSDVTAAGTLYYTPFKSGSLVYWDGAAWKQATITEISLALTLTSAKNYDVFVACTNSTTCALSLSSAWTNDTTRADAIATQNGVTVLSSDHTKLWVGTIRASGTNTTEDSAAKRFVFNTFNRALRRMSRVEATASWTYTGAAFQQANASASNQVEQVVGAADGDVSLSVQATFSHSVVGGGLFLGIGDGSTTAISGYSSAKGSAGSNGAGGTTGGMSTATWSGTPSLGYHAWEWLEATDAATVTVYGTATGAQYTSGMSGWARQ